MRERRADVPDREPRARDGVLRFVPRGLRTVSTRLGSRPGRCTMAGRRRTTAALRSGEKTGFPGAFTGAMLIRSTQRVCQRILCGEGGIRTRGRVLARRPLSKRVPSATRSPLLSGDGRSTAPFPTAQLRRSIDLDFVPDGRCRRGTLGLYFAARRTTQAVMPPMPSISLNPVFPGPSASEAPSLVTMASGRRMFGWSCSGFTVVG